MHRVLAVVVLLLPSLPLPASLLAQGRPLPPLVPITPIAAPTHPLPGEAASAGVTRFSFVVYGDTRGPRDSLELQEAHGWVVESVLHTVAQLARGPDPVRFVLQTGDAVSSGVYGKMFNVGLVPLLNRLTTEGGAPIYKFTGEPDLKAYIAAGAAQKLKMEHLLRPSTDTMLNPHHYLVVHVDGEQLTVQAIGVGWGSWWSPYPQAGLVLKP